MDCCYCVKAQKYAGWERYHDWTVIAMIGGCKRLAQVCEIQSKQTPGTGWHFGPNMAILQTLQTDVYSHSRVQEHQQVAYGSIR